LLVKVKRQKEKLLAVSEQLIVPLKNTTQRRGDNMTSRMIEFVGVGAVGIFLAHMIESKVQKNEEYPWAHMSRIALYWSLGALAYFAVFRG
tara:strand:+ start:11334 stop:11606 length:273 start_codon:yes stop_codon:yes gene_type:complete